MSPFAICFGDVDNNADSELVVGDIYGSVSIFKYLSGNGRAGKSPGDAPWLTIGGLGTITCVAVGDYDATDLNSILVTNAEGELHVLAVQGCQDTELVLLRTMTATLNVSRILCGRAEVVFARTDRQASVFRVVCSHIQGPKTNKLHDLPILEQSVSLEHVFTYTLDGQITSMVFHKGLLLLSQPGGAFCIIKSGKVIKSPCTAPSMTSLAKYSLGLDSLPSCTYNCRQVGTELVSLENLVCAVASDGIISFHNLETGMQRSLDLEVSHQLFAAKVIGDKVMCCGNNGSVYIVDSDLLNVVHILGKERVCAFAAGTFTLARAVSKLCFAQVNFSRTVQIVKDINLNLAIETIQSRINMDPATVRTLLYS